MTIKQATNSATIESLRAIIVRQMADVLLENDTDLGNINACRSELARANFGCPAIDALVERACDLAVQDFITNWKSE